ncbi:MAG TPA: hypothetical protein VF698_13435 [Thermoanaerobaculia bacterium]
MSGSAIVTIDALPATQTVTGGGAYCAGGAGVSVGLANSDSGISYQLQRDGSNVGAPVAGTGAAISFGNQTTAGTYTVIATNAATCSAQMSGNAIITIDALPATQTVTGGGAYCAGGAGVSVGLVSSDTGISYQLQRDGSNVGAPIAGTGAAISFGNQTTAGTYTVIATNAATCSAQMSGTAVVTITPVPAGTITAAAAICAASTNNVASVAGAGPTATFAWSITGGVITSGAATGSITYTAGSADPLTLSVVITENGCTSTVNRNVTVNAIPAVPAITAPASVCGTLPTPASITAPVAGVTYTWSITGGTLDPSSGTSVTFTPAAIGTNVVLTATASQNGCSSAAANATVIVAVPLSPVAMNGGAACTGGTIKLMASGVAGATYQWTGPNGFTSTEQNPILANATAAHAGNYSVVARIGSCNSAPATTTVVVHPPTPAPIASNSGATCAGSSVALSASTVAGATYFWTGPNGFLSTEQHPVINNLTVAAAGTYSVVAFVDGCASPAASTTVTVAAAGCPPPTPVDIVLNKGVSNALPGEGDTVTFTITAENRGQGQATAITVNDPLPAGLTFVDATPSAGVYAAGAWTIPALGQGAKATLQIRATVNSGTALSTISNCVTLGSVTPPDVNAANNSACTPIAVQPPDLEVLKNVDNPVPNVGDVIHYTVRVTNRGPGAAPFANINVNDILPQTVNLLTFTATQGSWSSATGDWAIGTIAAGANATLNVTAQVNALGGTQKVRNCATLTLSSPPDVNAFNNQSCAPVDLSVTKTVSKPVAREGDTIFYTVTITNNGPSYATDVMVNSVQVDGLTFVRWSATQGSYTGQGSGSWNVGTLGVGESATIILVAIINPGTAGTTINNCANLAGSAPNDDDPNNNQGCATIQVVAGELPDLSVTKLANLSSVNEGGQVTYTIRVFNNGSGTASNVNVDDALPAALTLVSSSATAGSFNGTRWSVGSLAEGASQTLTVTATANRPPSGTSVNNCASIATANLNGANDTACAAIEVILIAVAPPSCDNAPPLLSVPLLQTIERGATLKFRVAATDADLDHVTLRAEGLPSNARFDGATGEVTFAPLDGCDPEDASYALTFVATDGRGGITSAPVVLTLAERDTTRKRVVGARPDLTRQPVIAIPQAPVSIAAGEGVTFKVTAMAQEANCATTLVMTSDFGAFDGTSYRYTATTSEARRIRLASFRATDCRGRVSTATVPLHVGSATSQRSGLVAVKKLTFAPAVAGADARAATLTVTNAGRTALRISSVGLAGGEHFRVEGLQTAPIALLPSRTLELRVVFDPERAGSLTDQLQIATSDGDALVVDLSGEALAPTATPTESGVAAALTGSVVRPYTGSGPVLQLGPATANASCVTNREPVLSVPSLLVAERDQILRFRASALDPDGDRVSIGVAHLPLGASFNSSTGEFTFMPADSCEDDADRVHDVTFIATDERGASTSAAVQITVVEPAGGSTMMPIISAPATTLVVGRGEPVRFRIAAQGRRAGCEASLQTVPDVGRFDRDNGEYVFVPAADSPSGPMLLTFAARDCAAGVMTSAVRVEVRDDHDLGQARIASTLREVEFTATPTRSVSGYVIIPIANEGDRPLQLGRIRFANGDSFRIDGALGLPVMLRPGAILPLRVEFQPRAAGEITDTLIIENGDPTQPPLSISLRGTSIDR